MPLKPQLPFDFEGAAQPAPAGLLPASVVFNSVYPISTAAKKYIDQNAFFCKVPRGEHFITAGAVCRHMFILNKGVVRGYIRDGKREVTTWITAEGEMVTSISSFFTQNPSQESIQALEDCEVTVFQFDTVQYCFDHFSELNIVARKVLEQYYMDAEERAYIARLSKASAKYAYFLKNKSHLTNRIQLTHIASFLNMTLETLSRLRSKLSKAK